MKTMELDGSTGEGGGQILRTALALSMCTGRPLALRNIRAKRAKPGLMRQHLACVQAAAAISDAQVQGAELGSQTLTFDPATVRAGEYRFDIGSAGSCSLVLQTILPPLMLASSASQITLRGGTHNPMAPPYHFLERSFAPLLQQLGPQLNLSLKRLGFYPAGGGEFVARIEPSAHLTPFDLLERGSLREAYAECLAPAVPHRVVTRELDALGHALGWSGDQLRAPVTRQNEGPGNALMATLAFDHVQEVFTAFGEKRVSSEQVAAIVAKEVQHYQRGTGALGPHLADQWMLPLALAVAQRGGSASFTCTELTEHARTNIGVITGFMPVHFDVSGGAGHWQVTVAH